MNQVKGSSFLVCAILSSLSISSFAQENIQPSLERLSPEQRQALTKPAFRLTSNPENYRNTFFPPLVSYILPGLGQWIEGQYTYASIYTGLGVSGFALQLSAARSQQKFADLGTRDPEIRKSLIGGSLYAMGGGLSAYQSFHTTISNQRKRFDYIDPRLEEEPGDLALAPFHFSYMGRHTTYVPLGIGLVLGGLNFALGTKWYGPTIGDVGMTSVMSYSAGVNEEAAFRGYLMPWIHSQVGTNWGSNLISSLIFAAAHYSSDLRVPWPQFTLGYYLGYLSQANGWTLGENVFIHTWWDVIAFLSDFASTQKVPNFMIGPYQFHF